MLIFLVGALLGVLMGGALCVRYLRREVADDIGPKLKRLQLQLDNIETELNLAISTRYAELSASSPGTSPASCRHPHDRLADACRVEERQAVISALSAAITARALTPAGIVSKVSTCRSYLTTSGRAALEQPPHLNQLDSATSFLSKDWGMSAAWSAISL